MDLGEQGAYLSGVAKAAVTGKRTRLGESRKLTM